MEPLRLAIIGCGVMGRRHVHGACELINSGLKSVKLVAVCDLRRQLAAEAADAAEHLTGSRPRLVSTIEELIRQPDIEAVVLATEPATHHVIGSPFLEAGKHVMVEKPIAVTVKAGRTLLRSAQRGGALLSVAENFRRDPINRLAKAVIQQGVIGKPEFIIHNFVGGGNSIFVTPWRHMKERGGLSIDMGVHYTDLLEYFLGPLKAVCATSALIRPTRAGLNMAVSAEILEHEAITGTADDFSAGILRFECGARGQWTLHLGAYGAPLFQRVVYGSNGSLTIPGDRSGAPLVVQLKGGKEPVQGADVLSLVPEFTLCPVTATLFGASTLSAYDLPFPVIDRKLIAIEYADFAASVRNGRAPEVDGERGLRALAAIYAFFESAAAGAPVAVQDVLDGRVSHYQDEINGALSWP